MVNIPTTLFILIYLKGLTNVQNTVFPMLEARNICCYGGSLGAIITTVYGHMAFLILFSLPTRNTF